jgi:hypothetical protein
MITVLAPWRDTPRTDVAIGDGDAAAPAASVLRRTALTPASTTPRTAVVGPAQWLPGSNLGSYSSDGPLAPHATKPNLPGIKNNYFASGGFALNRNTIEIGTSVPK